VCDLYIFCVVYQFITAPVKKSHFVVDSFDFAIVVFIIVCCFFLLLADVKDTNIRYARYEFMMMMMM
jgi:hypothetical protein